jgi:hypothetical protein
MRRVLMAGIAIVAAACGNDASGRDSVLAGTKGSDRAAGDAPGGSVQAADQATPCPADGLWHPCSVRKRFEMAGFVLRDSAGDIREEPLTVEGTRFALGRSTLTLFYYPDARVRAADEARLDTTRYVDAGRTLSLRREATRVSSANLLAILRSTSDHQRERVADLLGAGPPQPRVP